MDRDRRVRIYDLHAWTGITLGLFLFVVSFTGCLALFVEELKAWEDPATRIPMPEQLLPIHSVLEHWVDTSADGGEAEFVSLSYPGPLRPYYQAWGAFHDSEGHDVIHEQRWNAATGEPLPARGSGLTEWLLDFHRDLMWPETLGGGTAGRTLVGLAGIIMMLSIISGLVTHRKMFRESYTLRLRRSVRLRWKDSHNMLALWGLPFSTMIAFTGAFLGIISLLLPLTGALIAKGDTEKLFAVLGVDEVAGSGVAATMLSVDDVYGWRHVDNDQRPVAVLISHWGDAEARYEIRYPADSELLLYEVTTANGATGERLPNEGFFDETAVNRTVSALTPLHYGTWGGPSVGGITLKLLYFVLGLALCAMIALGLMVWLERRLHGVVGTRSEAFYQRIQQLVVGVTLGNMMASVAIFYLDKLFSGVEETRISWTGITYFLSWFAVLGYAFLNRDIYRTVRHLTALFGLGLLLLPLLNALVTQDTVFLLRAPSGAAWWVDASLTLLGLFACLIVPFIPQSRLQIKQGKKGSAIAG